MAKRQPFNALVDPATKRTIQANRKNLDVSEGQLIDLWALLYNVGKAGSPELKTAASNLLTLIRTARDEKKGKR